MLCENGYLLFYFLLKHNIVQSAYEKETYMCKQNVTFVYIEKWQNNSTSFEKRNYIQFVVSISVYIYINGYGYDNMSL